MLVDHESPNWPSLYNAGLELLHIEDRPPEAVGGVYLHRYKDIFSFTLYWTLVLSLPIYFACSALAFCNVVFPGRKRSENGEWWEMQLLQHCERPRKTNEGRSRVAFALLVVFIYMVMSFLGCLVGSTITSLIMMGLYRSGGYSMSTWMPFLAAVMQVLVGVLTSWPPVINII